MRMRGLGLGGVLVVLTLECLDLDEEVRLLGLMLKEEVDGQK